MPQEEQWAPTGFPHIVVSDQGRVKDTWTGSIRKMFLNQEGKVTVQARHPNQGDRSYNLPVAKLVLVAFVGHHNDPTFGTPLHIDGDFTNCKLENLTWAPLHHTKKYYSYKARGLNYPF